MVARAFHRHALMTFVKSGACVKLVPGSFSGITMDEPTSKPLQIDNAELSVAAAFPEGDYAGLAAQLLRCARAIVLSQSGESTARAGALS
ncbi:hypothetical protein FHS79_000234 [Polymorphobacter multimanifer]|uniref:Uncharacterized protein n=1 Tax=Polymorphobacter multimanifer TaxID=1070431 RepID=A0A841L3R3_9SPHN|nr:hypothetical protein [Polymorphobacter multimanifer]MBB6226081.1 hypothetical protein [Polymorphobacter multimanifer]